jgi:hypothetical protein
MLSDFTGKHSPYNLGCSAPYAERLLFEVPESATEDLDESVLRVLHQSGGKIKDLATGTEQQATDRVSGTVRN